MTDSERYIQRQRESERLQKDTQIEIPKTETHRERQIDTQRYRQTDRHMKIQTETKTEKQRDTERKIERETETKT